MTAPVASQLPTCAASAPRSAALPSPCLASTSSPFTQPLRRSPALPCQHQCSLRHQPGAHRLHRAVRRQQIQAQAQAAPAQTVQFTSFDDMIANSTTPVLVDFHATWCGPCQMMTRVLTNLSKKLGASLKVVKVDTDKYPQIASRYGVQALPTLMLFRNGEVVDRIEGLVAEATLLQRMRYYINYVGS